MSETTPIENDTSWKKYYTASAFFTYASPVLLGLVTGSVAIGIVTFLHATLASVAVSAIPTLGSVLSDNFNKNSASSLSKIRKRAAIGALCGAFVANAFAVYHQKDAIDERIDQVTQIVSSTQINPSLN